MDRRTYEKVSDFWTSDDSDYFAFEHGLRAAFRAGISSESNFPYPNSNVVPIGRAVGEATDTGFGVMFVTGDLIDRAVKNALEQKKGDILINYVTYADFMQFPLIPITTITVRVEGTAAKMEIENRP